MSKPKGNSSAISLFYYKFYFGNVNCNLKMYCTIHHNRNFQTQQRLNKKKFVVLAKQSLINFVPVDIVKLHHALYQMNHILGHLIKISHNSFKSISSAHH